VQRLYDAALVEAVNTIVVTGRALVGHNTDVEGVRVAIEAACDDSLRGAPGLILGAGGAARAAALALARLGVRLTVVNRTPAAADWPNMPASVNDAPISDSSAKNC